LSGGCRLVLGAAGESRGGQGQGEDGEKDLSDAEHGCDLSVVKKAMGGLLGFLPT
jgi:hypothetical protein